jgi:hypothetical protein
MERMIQLDNTGCGLACVAMVVGCSYEEIRTFTIDELGFDPCGPFSTDYADLRIILAEYGYKLSRYTPFTGYETLGPLCIMGIERGGSGEEDHWVLHVKCELDRYVLDPTWRVQSERRRDWWRLSPISYANILRL